MPRTAEKRTNATRRNAQRTVDPHEVAEQARLLSHRLYANELRRSSTLVDDARREIDASVARGGGTVGERLWQALLKHDLEEVISHMLDEGEAGRLLRSNSPFSRLIGVTDDTVRTRLWKQAKAEVSARQISRQLVNTARNWMCPASSRKCRL